MHPDLGLHFIVGLTGTHISQNDKLILETIRPASIILFERNFSLGDHYEQWIGKVAKLIDDVKNIVKREKLIVSIDHEGGRVTRIPFPINRTPYAHNFKNSAYKVAKIHAQELSSVGANFSYAPVADIYSNPLNEVIGARSFGKNPGEVCEYALPYYRSLREEKIIGCVKHFPGHGDTAIDSHFSLPVIVSSLEELKEKELIPFKALIDDGVETLMTAHILFPNLDTKPATFSSIILSDLLRNDLTFKGVILSDDIEMLAVAEEFEKKEGIVQAFNAGCDMFIASRNRFSSKNKSDLSMIVFEHFKAGVDSKIIKEETLSESQDRITKLLSKTKNNKPHMLDKNILRDNYNHLLDMVY